jgi:hypothetical protein
MSLYLCVMPLVDALIRDALCLIRQRTWLIQELALATKGHFVSMEFNVV